ncbi:MAG: cyanophycinase [Gemmatimonadaceae bacterium]
MPSRPHPDVARGWIIPIGGKLLDPAILDRFVDLSGGRDARIAIIPTASSEPDIGTFYERVFAKHRVAKAKSLRFERRSDCDDRDWLEWLGNATGIFISGGNQLKLTATLGGTSVAKLMRIRNAAGVHIAGTSAGAAFLSEHMIAYGDEGITPRAGMVNMCAGLGLTNRVIFDQHFRQRDRLGRLLTALAYNPFAVGLGVDEDTAAFIAPDETVEVVGSGAVTIVDPSSVQYSSIAEAKLGEPVTLLGVKVHVLAPGATFNLHTRQPHGSTVFTLGT